MHRDYSMHWLDPAITSRRDEVGVAGVEELAGQTWLNGYALSRSRRSIITPRRRNDAGVCTSAEARADARLLTHHA